MGGGFYDSDRATFRSVSEGYRTKSTHEIFTSRSLDNGMDPKNAKLRESCDSVEHPESIAIILALDETGSMGHIPKHLIQDGLPKIMSKILQKGIKDPQILFLGIGDHEVDEAPLQVGQFESSDELLDHWLKKVYLEGGGGPAGGVDDGESYLLAWYFASQHTKIDCWDKRKKKGFLFTIGDEPTLKKISKSAIAKIMGNAPAEDYSSVSLLEKAREKYEVYHLHVKEGNSGQKRSVIDGWKQLMGDHLIEVENHEDISKIIPDIIIAGSPDISKPVSKEKKTPDKKPVEKKEEDYML